MDKFIRLWVGLVSGWPKTVVLAVFFVTACLASGLPRLLSMPMRPVLEGSIPESDPWVAEWKKVREIFPHRDFSLVAVECDELEGIYSPSCLSLVRDIGYELESFPGRKSEVQSIFKRSYTPLSSTGELRIEPIAKEETLYSPEERTALAKKVKEDPELAGRIVSKDGKATILWFASGAEQKEAYPAMEKIRVDYSNKEHAILPFSNHWINGSIEKMVVEDTGLLGGLGLLFIVFLMALSLSGHAVPIVILVVVLAIVSTYGLMGYLGVPQNVLTSAVPLLLIATASASSFHLVVAARRNFRRKAMVTDSSKEAVEKSLKNLFSAIVLSEATTAASFLTLFAFQIVSVREFGLFAGVAVTVAMTLSLTLAPALLVTGASRAVTGHSGKMAAAFERINKKLVGFWITVGLEKKNFAFGGSLAVVLLVSILGLPKLEAGSNPPYFFPEGHPVRRVFDGWNKHFGADGFLTVMVDSGRENGIYDPAFMKKIMEFGAYGESLPGVTNAISLAKPVARLNRALLGGEAKNEIIPDEEPLVRELLMLYGNSAPGEMRESRDEFKRYMTVDFLANVNDSAKVAALRDKLKSWAKTNGLKTYMGGEFFLWCAQNVYIVIGLINNKPLSLLVVFLLCSLVYRSAVIGLMVTAPVALSMLSVLAVMGLAGIRLDLANCTVSVIVVGLGVNFAVHLASAMERLSLGGRFQTMESLIREAILEAGPAIQYNALATMGFLIFLWSGFVPVRSFGWLVATSMVVATTFSFLTLPFLFQKSRKWRSRLEKNKAAA